MRLQDGEVIPHYLGIKNTASNYGSAGFFDEARILVGEVTKVHYPGEKSNISGRFTEYTVIVWRRHLDKAQERIAFHCFQSDAFGSVADLFRFTFRPATADLNKETLSNGATVLVACINGDRSNSYIIGAIPQPNNQQKDPASGKNLYFQFNGTEAKINDDGSFELTVPGPTDTDGQPLNRDSNNNGSHLSFGANGDITIDDKNGDSIVINSGSKTIEIKASNAINESAKTISVQADTSISETSMTKTETSAVSWKLTAPMVTVISPNVNLGAPALTPSDSGVVLGGGTDTFTGITYSMLNNASKTVKANK